MKGILNPGFIAVYRDLRDYFLWIKTIKREKRKKNSLWNKFGLDHNIFYTIYFVVTLPDEDAPLTDYLKRLRLIEMLAPVNRYLDDLGFAEYLVPEFNNIVETSTNKVTLSYGVVYRFAFNRLSLKWFITKSISIAILIYVAFQIPWNNLITWISSLN